MKIAGIEAVVKRESGDQVADVTITLDNGDEITLVLLQSALYSNTIVVNIDGDFLNDDPSLRISLNDSLIHDSTRNDPELASPRRPDIGPSRKAEQG